MGQGDDRLADVGVAGARGVGGAQRGEAAAPGGSLQLQRELRLEAERRAAEHLVAIGGGGGHVVGGAEDIGAGPGQHRGGLEHVAAGRVQHEAGAVDVDADVAQVQGDAAEDVGDRVRAGGVDRGLRGRGVDADRRAHDDDAEVEGADEGGVDRHDRERRAVVGAGQVEAARRPGEGAAHPVAGQGVADRAGRRAARAGQLLGAASAAWRLRSPRRGSRGCRRACRSARAGRWPSRR